MKKLLWWLVLPAVVAAGLVLASPQEAQAHRRAVVYSYYAPYYPTYYPTYYPGYVYGPYHHRRAVHVYAAPVVVAPPVYYAPVYPPAAGYYCW